MTQRVKAVTNATYGEITLLGNGTAASIGQGRMVKIRGGTIAGGTPSSVTKGYIVAEVNSLTVYIPYY